MEESAADLELFLEMVPLRMRNALAHHQELDNLIEVVMDFGRKPLAQFPSGDWVISEEPVMREDLQHAISKVIYLNDIHTLLRFIALIIIFLILFMKSHKKGILDIGSRDNGS